MKLLLFQSIFIYCLISLEVTIISGNPSITEEISSENVDEIETNIEPVADETLDDPPKTLPKYPTPKYDNDNNTLQWFPRIIGGTDAFLGEFMGKVSLQTRRGSHMCGGTLVNLNHVLTAAHCVADGNGNVLANANFRLMADDLSIDSRGSPSRQIRFPLIIFVHVEYDPWTFANDIAVIRADSNFMQTRTLNYMRLSLHTPVVGQKCRLAGWGATVEDGRAAPRLQRVNLAIVDTVACNSTISYNGFMPPNTFCAGTMMGGRDSCQGDSGGALLCNNLIQGIVSFGYGCGRPRFPGVYADVSFYTRWIESTYEYTGDHVSVPRPPPRPPGSSTILINSIGLMILSAGLTIFGY